jgi:hypothetical protein
MGEARAKQSATAKFVAQYPECCFCGATRPAVTREHMPPKALFDGSHRPDKLIMPACDECNRGTSTADLVAAIVARWNYNSDEVEPNDHHRLVARVRAQHKELFEEWSGMNAIDRIRARQHLKKYGVPVPPDAGMVQVGPHTIRQLNLFAHKTVLALYFEQFRTPLAATGAISAYWRTKEDFARGGIPAALLEMMHRYGTLEQGKWNTKETFEYRFNLNPDDRIFMCLARFRGGLFTCGFAINDATSLPQDDIEWIKPPALLRMLDTEQFAKKR